MDPNVALERLLSICEQWEEWGELEQNPIAALDEVAELFLGLNEWISSGGFLPNLWRV